MSDIESMSNAERTLHDLEVANKKLQEAEAELKDQEEAVAADPEPEAHDGEGEVVTETQYSDVEKEAMAKGWKPDGGPKSAEEWLRSEPLYKEISASHKKITELKQIVDTLSGQMKQQEERGYKKAIDDLQNQRIEAIQLGDVETVNQIEEQIKSYEQPAEPEHHQTVEAQEFMSRHDAWLKDPSYEAQKIREFAEKRDKELLGYNLSPTEHIKVIEQDLKHEFGNSRFFKGEESEVTRTQAVENRTPSAPSKQSIGLQPKDLDDAERQVYYYLKNTDKTGKSAKDYIKQVQKLRGK